MMADVPRVTDDHLAARRQQILTAADTCFRRNGFHNTSMQDVIAEAGLSVGAVYRYFKSKDDLITSIAETVLDGADEIFEGLSAHDPPESLLDTMARALGFVDAQTGPDGIFPLALQVWAEAQRDQILADFVAEKYTLLRQHFVAVAARARDTGELPPDANVTAIGAVLFGMLPGYALQRTLAAGPDKDTYLQGVKALMS
jgi:AcrR family transcriptional regulator